jgi:hypothetical protein
MKLAAMLNDKSGVNAGKFGGHSRSPGLRRKVQSDHEVDLDEKRHDPAQGIEPIHDGVLNRSQPYTTAAGNAKSRSAVQRRAGPSSLRPLRRCRDQPSDNSLKTVQNRTPEI